MPPLFCAYASVSPLLMILPPLHDAFAPAVAAFIDARRQPIIDMLSSISLRDFVDAADATMPSMLAIIAGFLSPLMPFSSPPFRCFAGG